MERIQAAFEQLPVPPPSPAPESAYADACDYCGGVAPNGWCIVCSEWSPR
jgi:hypothetical protein